MNSDPSSDRRSFGFRFSGLDAFAIFLFAAAGWFLKAAGSELWYLLAVVAAHFFLFCNVLRISRRLELLWAGCFLINCLAWEGAGLLEWQRILACQIPITFLVSFRGMRSPSYHGVFCRRLNPQLDAYLRARIR